MVKEFDFFLNRGDVKKQRPDYNTARAVFSEGIERLRFAKSLVNQAKSKYVLENAYEALKGSCRRVTIRLKASSHIRTRLLLSFC